ncbi:alkyl hydroperoxide reductase subunit F [Altericroceibacterium endophyticum]|uniref:Thioredoxin reductase n=1 Tax=Altericroceibacterium endophyticum TaxID=1808508 RepID=A0A6I4T426_9SPHN|nr:alkyl hydroperoxide reductase subunit F [Altericroceibacterium endophyticum]MXO65079.1 alkyl hydroperoxide reductase subunit F [Altericroceibacterium endophyticum]
MLDANMKEQLKQYLGNLREPIELVASLGDDAKSGETRELLEEIAELNDKVSASFDGNDARKPSFEIRRASDHDASVRFAGLPLGHEFTSLVLALLWAGGHPPKVSDEVLSQVRALEGDFAFEMYFSLSCQNCPDVVQALTLLALNNKGVKATLIEGGAFQAEVEQRKVMAVPAVYMNGESFANGRMNVEEILAKLDSNAGARAAEKLNAKKPVEVLVVGGGPAGASAAIYTARKGFSTSIAAERMGGQVMDTMGIENFISVPYTEGPKLAAALERHIAEYDIDVINLQRAERLIKASETGGYHEVVFENGGTLKARSLILTTGARWRQLGVPGESEYAAKGVAYCPHCDGPLYKGKRVAVIGGGNSGVEAAIDLANIVKHVTLVEFADTLRADEVLQKKLRSMKNVDILTSAATTEITGDGEKVNGLRYKNRETDEEQTVELEGVFVQIGLVPNTEWLRDSGLNLTKFGEIEIDHKAATNIPGIFAAGDCTTVPYKQIVIAMGEGSKAGLSAFDFLIRNEAPEEIAQSAQKKAELA